MELEERIQRFIDGLSTSEENRELLNELVETGKLGEVLLSDAATLFMYSREELLQYFSPQEVDEIEEMRNTLTAPEDTTHTLENIEETLRAVAEKDNTKGKDKSTL